MTNGAHQVAMH
jgi:hypothetical protein